MFTRSNLSRLVVALVLFIVVLSYSQCAKADERSEIRVCMTHAAWNSAKWSAAYGGAVLGLGATFAVVFAPVGTFTVVTGVAVIAGDAITGALIGGGSSFVTTAWYEAKLKYPPLLVACQMEYNAKHSKVSDWVWN